MDDAKEKCDDTKTDLPTSSTSKDLNKSLPEEAFNNFLQGKRHMLVQDYSFAVQSLATACELYVKHFGELAIECGEVYFLYGKALFRLSQQQAGILGEALNDGSNEDENSSESESKENDESEKNSEEEGEDSNEAEAEAEADKEEKEEKEPSESTDSPPAVIDEASNEAKAKEENSSKSSKEMEIKEESVESKGIEDAQISSSDDAKVEEKADENQEVEEDDLELAWNTLETAKSIFKRQDTVESQLKVAEILQLLAEISMESDNNAAAINDLKECLGIQKKHLKPDDRILAETYYQMGLAQLLDKQYYEALENFRTTKQILELRLENLKNTPVNESAGSFASADKDVEISDLENILLDIQEKIEDTEELIRNTKKELEEAFASESMVTSPVKEKIDSSASSKPVSNITHLLKRKKPEGGASETDSKRIKMSTNVPNGDSKVSASETLANADG